VVWSKWWRFLSSPTSVRGWTSGVIAVGAIIPLLLWGGAFSGTPHLHGQSSRQSNSLYRSGQSSFASDSGSGEWQYGLIAQGGLRLMGSTATPVPDRTLSAVLPRTHAQSPSAPTWFVGEVFSAAQAEAASTLGSAVPSQILRWQPFIEKYASQYGLDPNLLAAIIMTESSGNPNATSSRGAVGLMQVVGGSYDPETNIAQGTKIFADDLRQFNGDVELALAAYNAGPASVSRYQGIPPYLETENYVFEVMNRYYLYSPT
jgi:hypothetical protein